jgi:hypothetical protein
MRHSQISRNSAKAFFAFVTIGLATACTDTVAPPTNEVAAIHAPAAFNRTVGVQVFRVNHLGTTQLLGRHTLNIPADAICDPMTSSYGPTEWDKPCNLLKRSIVITATLLEDNEGRPYVEFEPALRFAPDKEVNLYLRSGRNSSGSMLNIDYCNALGCVDESLKDASLVTQRIGRSAVLVRRIKHFSGYMISSGRACAAMPTEEMDGTQMCSGGSSMARRSGYMVASGLNDNDHDNGNSGSDDRPAGGRKRWDE